MPRRLAALVMLVLAACGDSSVPLAEIPQLPEVTPAELRAELAAFASSPGPHAGVQHGDIAAHAVAHQVNRLAGGVVVQQEVEVGQVVGKPVVVGIRGAGQAKAAPVRRKHVPRRAQRIHQELKRRRNIHPAVEQHDLSGARIRPAPHVIAQAADLLEQRLAVTQGS